ncbi:MAG: hypothetical protein ACLR7D_11000 [Lachnospira eligens]
MKESGIKMYTLISHLKTEIYEIWRAGYNDNLKSAITAEYICRVLIITYEICA